MNETIKEILKIFVSWTKLKVKIHLSEKEVYPKVRGIFLKRGNILLNL